MLLEAGADCNLVLDEEGVAPMHVAVGISLEALRLLLQYGGDPNIRSVEGVTPLHIAATWGEMESVKLLLFNGGDPGILDQEGLRAVDVARTYNHDQVACYLQYYALLLLPGHDDMQPRYTRQSLDSHRDCPGGRCGGCSGQCVGQCGHRGHADLSFTHSDPDYREGCSTYEARARLQDFHMSRVGRHRHCGNTNNSSSACVQEELCRKYGNTNNSNGRCVQEDFCRRCRGEMCHDGSPSRRNTYKTRLCRDCEYPGSHHCRHSDHCLQSEIDSVPVKARSNPHLLPSPHWTELQKPETSAEKIGRWQSSCFAGNGDVPDRKVCCHQRVFRRDSPSPCTFQSSGLPPVAHSESQSPNRFFSLLPEHDYKASPEAPQCILDSTDVSEPEWNSKPADCSLTTAEHRDGQMLDKHSLDVHETTGDARSRQFGGKALRRSSMYTQNVQKELDQYLRDGQSVLLDVTSPGHPYVQVKPRSVEDMSVSRQLVSPSAREAVHTVHSQNAHDNHPSLRDDVSEASCCTFVTCEDDTDFTLMTPIDNIGSSVVAQVNNLGELGFDPVPKVEPINREAQSGVVWKKQIDPTPYLQSTSPEKHRHPSHPVQDRELDLSRDVKSWLSNSGAPRNQSNNVQSDIRSFSPSKRQWQPPTDLIVDLNLSDLVTSDDSFLERTENAASNRVPRSDFNRSRINSQVKKTVEKWLAPSVLDNPSDSDLMTSDESFQQRERRRKDGGCKISNLVDQLDRVSMINKTSARNPNKTKRISLESGFSNASSAKEYFYRDKERGITLLERHVPSTCDEDSTRESFASSCSSPTFTSEDTELYSWQDYQSDTEDTEVVQGTDASCSEAGSPRTPVPRDLSRLSNAEIRKKLQSLGDDPGPVVSTTRQAYLVRLTTLEADPAMASQLKLSTDAPVFSSELRAALQGNLDLTSIDEMEKKMIESFESSQGRCWREGTQKSSFNYLLLDPRVTRNLPLRAKNLSQAETFKAFIHAIFYVGKGKRARPYCHLYEAIRHLQTPKPKVSTKVQHIIDIWNEGLGVVSLHCFQSVIPVEAYTREACMVEAIGLAKLTNVKRGDYYGATSTWPPKSKKSLGVRLLQKALQIFLGEGERQISPIDMKTGTDKS